MYSFYRCASYRKDSFEIYEHHALCDATATTTTLHRFVVGHVQVMYFWMSPSLQCHLCNCTLPHIWSSHRKEWISSSNPLSLVCTPKYYNDDPLHHPNAVSEKLPWEATPSILVVKKSNPNMWKVSYPSRIQQRKGGATCPDEMFGPLGCHLWV